jgi:uncharacterized protein (TIGR02246 family)
VRRKAVLAGCLSIIAEIPAAAGAQQQSRAEASKQDRQIDPEVRQFFAVYFRAVEAGDPSGILALIDQDFVIKWPVGAPVTDRERLRAALGKLQQAVRQKIEWEVLETRVHGEWAWARVAEKSIHVPKAGGEPRTLEGSHLAILRKAGGNWLLYRDYGSLNELPPMR